MRYTKPFILPFSLSAGIGVCETGSAASTSSYWDCNVGSNISTSGPGYTCMNGDSNNSGARQCNSGGATNAAGGLTMCSSGGLPAGSVHDCSFGTGV